MTTTPAVDGAKTAAGKLRQEARKLTSLAMGTLESIMQGTGQDSVRLAAAREVLDRGHGKPRPATRAKAKPPAGAKPLKAVRVIVKRFSDITAEEQAAADATERGEW